jgi:hypothetical protein
VGSSRDVHTGFARVFKAQERTDGSWAEKKTTDTKYIRHHGNRLGGAMFLPVAARAIHINENNMESTAILALLNLIPSVGSGREIEILQARLVID